MTILLILQPTKVGTKTDEQCSSVLRPTLVGIETSGLYPEVLPIYTLPINQNH
jgi:hypothetical protein